MCSRTTRSGGTERAALGRCKPGTAPEQNLPTLSLELRTTAWVWGTRTTWWSKPAVGSQTRAGSLWLSRESSEISRCVFCSLVGSVANRLPIAIRDLMNSRSGASLTGCKGLGRSGRW